MSLLPSDSILHTLSDLKQTLWAAEENICKEVDTTCLIQSYKYLLYAENNRNSKVSFKIQVTVIIYKKLKAKICFNNFLSEIRCTSLLRVFFVKL